MIGPSTIGALSCIRPRAYVFSEFDGGGGSTGFGAGFGAAGFNDCCCVVTYLPLIINTPPLKGSTVGHSEEISPPIFYSIDMFYD
jgi:hypothetical protein